MTDGVVCEELEHKDSTRGHEDAQSARREPEKKERTNAPATTSIPVSGITTKPSFERGENGATATACVHVIPLKESAALSLTQTSFVTTEGAVLPATSTTRPASGAPSGTEAKPNAERADHGAAVV